MFGKYGLTLHKNGIFALPEHNYDGKAVPAVKHSHYGYGPGETLPSSDELDAWGKKYYDNNIGIRGDRVLGFDIDIDDADVVTKLVDYIITLFPNNTVIQRMGTAPRVLIPMFNKIDKNKVVSNIYSKKLEKGAIEVLGRKHKYTYYGTHRKTQKEYTEIGVKKLHQVKVTKTKSELPTLTSPILNKIFTYFNQLMEDKDFTVIKLSTLNTNKAIVELEADNTDTVLTALKSIGTQDYNEWLSIGMALHHQYGGSQSAKKIWKEYSESIEEDEDSNNLIDSSWLVWDNKTEEHPITFSFIEDLYAQYNTAEEYKRFNDCSSLREAISRFYFIMDGDVFDSGCSGVTDPIIKGKVFKDAYANVKILNTENKLVPLGNVWLSSKNRKTLSGLKYAPNEDRIIISRDANNAKIYHGNIHYPIKFKPTDNRDLLEPFFNHLRYLIPKDEECNWFLDWLAWLIQKPNEMCRVTPVLVSKDKGTGRGWLLALLERLLGAWNVASTTYKAIESEFNSFLFENQLVVIEEAGASKNKEALTTKLKDITTMVEGQKRGMRKEYIATKRTANLFLMANSITTLPIESNERRYNIFICDAKYKDQDYYDDLYELLHCGESNSSSAFVTQVFNYLKTRDITNMHASRCMRTEGWNLVNRVSLSHLEVVLDEYVTNNNVRAISLQQTVKLLLSVTSYSAGYISGKTETIIEFFRENKLTDIQMFNGVNTVFNIGKLATDQELSDELNNQDINIACLMTNQPIPTTTIPVTPSIPPIAPVVNKASFNPDWLIGSQTVIDVDDF